MSVDATPNDVSWAEEQPEGDLSGRTNWSRRKLLQVAAGASGSAAALMAGVSLASAQGTQAQPGDWDWVRGLFDLRDDTIHMSAMLLASHPKPVRDAIDEHRRGLDRDTVRYLERHDGALTAAAREAAASYLGVDSSHVALTDSTTMSVGLIYNGLILRPGDEVITTTEDYFVTHESLRLATARSGASMRTIELFDRVEDASADALVDRITGEIGPSTRLVALTWVHSSTGLKLPLPQLSRRLAEINADRDEADQVLLGVDGVHGFGIEDVSFDEIGCDFFMAGCHKWLFGPRGTGIAALSKRGLEAVRPLVPSFGDDAVFASWLQQRAEPGGVNTGMRMTPGGFKPFEHRWAMTPAFDLHARIGRARVADRTHELASALKEALAGISGINVRTPRAPDLSAGIVSFDVAGMAPDAVVSRLRESNIIASVAPYRVQHVRLTPSIRNTEAEIDQVASALRDIV